MGESPATRRRYIRMRPSFDLHSRGKILSLGKRTAIMGVVNVTPDSFYDGGRYSNESSAIEHAMALISEGADILDIGGQSTRPASQPVGVQEETSRVLPVLKAIRTGFRYLDFNRYLSE